MRLKTSQTWLFNPNSPGNVPLLDGRTSNTFEGTVAIGESYILKLVHIVETKLHARSKGPYSQITQQPVQGRARQGGQRIGEIEIWALEGFGASCVLQEILTVKSNALVNQSTRLSEVLHHNRPLFFGLSDSFRILVCELQSLCLDLFTFHRSNELIADY